MDMSFDKIDGAYFDLPDAPPEQARHEKPPCSHLSLDIHPLLSSNLVYISENVFTHVRIRNPFRPGDICLRLRVRSGAFHVSPAGVAFCTGRPLGPTFRRYVSLLAFQPQYWTSSFLLLSL